MVRLCFFGVIAICSLSNAALTRISQNVDSNGGVGIDLFNPSGAGVTRDPGDGDEGGNGLQNFPVLQSAIANSGSTFLSGTLNSLPNAKFVIAFYSSPQCDPTGYGEGKEFLGQVLVVTNSSGNATFQVAVAPTPEGSSVTAIATHQSTGNTSEFSACQVVSGPPGSR